MGFGVGCAAMAVAVSVATTWVAPPAVPSALPQSVLRGTVQQACTARLPLDVRIGQTMLVITADPAAARKRLERGLIAGMLSTGILDTAQARAFQKATADTKYGALLAADEEGGGVQRYRRVLGAIPSAQAQAASMTPAEVTALYRRHSKALAKWGVNLAFAPVVDVGHGPGIGNRSYSTDANTVTKYAAAAAEGMREAGLLPVLKHFPGHGRATADSHEDQAIGPGIAELRKIDLVPYRKLVGPGSATVAVMVGHTQTPGYSAVPASQSKKMITGVLRTELGFTGLVISDALGMAAVGQRSAQGPALVNFLRAGGDLGIVGLGGSVQGRKSVRAAIKAGELSEFRVTAAAARVLNAKGIDACPLPQGQAPAPDPSQDSGASSDDPIINPTKDPR
ncbi:MAG: glycoside hydrolase family 3 N-terminal domain-containing protein [Candidatus Nanopelagicales bacterium]